MFKQPLSGRTFFLNGSGRGDVVRRDRVAENGQSSRSVDVSRGRARFHDEIIEEWWFRNVGLLWPIVYITGSETGNFLPQFTGCCFDVTVILAE